MSCLWDRQWHLFQELCTVSSLKKTSKPEQNVCVCRKAPCQCHSNKCCLWPGYFVWNFFAVSLQQHIQLPQADWKNENSIGRCVCGGVFVCELLGIFGFLVVVLGSWWWLGVFFVFFFCKISDNVMSNIPWPSWVGRFYPDRPLRYNNNYPTVADT